ncbi:MAG: hypothetical protein ACRCXX_13720 [Cetobacterium sp.]|uniref:hypothetical protein n=1 Tax=Cetobacterium sp. TaxID=2071632 RepID=UPI003F30A664
MKRIFYDIEIDSCRCDFDIVVETNYTKQFVDFLNRKFPGRVSKNSFGGIKISSNFSNIDIIIIDKKLKSVYKNFLEFNSDSFIFDILNERFVDFDSLYVESLKEQHRIGRLIHPTLGVKRSEQREKNESYINYSAKKRHGKDVEVLYYELLEEFTLKKKNKYNFFLVQSFIEFIEILKEF